MSALTRNARQAGAHLREHGEPAAYRPGGIGEPLPVTVIDLPDAQYVGQSGYVELRHELHVAVADLAAPARGDTFTRDGQVLIVQTPEPAGPFWRLIVRRGGA